LSARIGNEVGDGRDDGEDRRGADAVADADRAVAGPQATSIKTAITHTRGMIV
jgi:hypothetical protein